MIDGVVLKSIITHADERGYFREISRIQEEFPTMQVMQMSHALVYPGVVKAWHGHQKQSQWNYVISGLIQVVLFDNRHGSPTYREMMEFLTGDTQPPMLYYFPPGILHGYSCINGPMHILYATSGVYDPLEEVRISQNDPLVGYNWQHSV